jgi:hypothetical protein
MGQEQGEPGAGLKFLARFQSLRSAKYKEHSTPQRSHSITKFEVEIGLFPTHGMHSKHFWCEGMLQKITMNSFSIFRHPPGKTMLLSARSGNNSYQHHADTPVVKTGFQPSGHSASVHH